MTIVMHTYENNNGVYLASYSDYSDEIIELSDPNEILSIEGGSKVSAAANQCLDSFELLDE